MSKPNTVGLGEYSTEDLVAEINQRLEKDANRLEVIDEEGRQYVKGYIYGTPVKVELSSQDDGKTLKIFVRRIS